MGTVGSAAYTFEPHPSRPDRDDIERFEGRLVRALRVGMAWNVRFALRWESGPRGGVRLEVERGTGSTWVDRVLDSPNSQRLWRPAAPPERVGPTALRTRWARRATRAELPLPSPENGPGGRWVDTVVSGLASLPSGISLRWDVRPLGLPLPSGPPPSPPMLQPVPTGFRAVPATTPERLALDDAVDRRSQAQWGVCGTLFIADPVAARAEDQAAQLVEFASRLPGRGGLVVAGSRSWWRLGPPLIRVAEAELRGFFPTPWSTVPLVDPAAGKRGHLRLSLRPPAAEPSLPISRNEGRHLLILGETGMGKSTLLVELAERAAQLGSVVLFDPIGDSAQRFIERLSAPDRERVVLIAPVSSPVGINAVPAADSDSRVHSPSVERARDDLVNALRRVRASRYEESSYWGPRLKELASLAIDAASRYPSGTLVDAQRLLEEAGRRTGPVPVEARSAVEELRRRVADRPEEIDGTRRLLSEITRNSLLRRMLCEPRARWIVKEALHPNRIVVVSGEAPRAGEAVARSLLAVHLALLWAELIARTRASKMFLVLDEVQWYAHESLGEMLRLGRRFNLHVWAATQSLSRLPLPLRDALLTNSAEIVLFRGSPEEAREFSRWSPMLRADEIGTLGPGRAVLFGDKGRTLSWLDRPLGGGIPEENPRSWGEVVDRSSAWVVRTLEDPSTGAPPARPTSVAGGGADSVRELVLVLWAGLLASEPAPSIRISLTRLRAAVDPEGLRVRELGRRLGDAGVRVEAGRDPEGAFWVVRRDGFSLLLAGGVEPAELTVATELWRRIAAGGAGSDPSERL